MFASVLAGDTDEQTESRFEEILRQYGELLRSAIARFCPQDLGLNTADIEQDARLRVWRALRSETKIDNLPSYLYRIAATTTIDAIRVVKARREEQLRLEADEEGVPPTALPPSNAISPEDHAARREGREIIQRAVGALPENRRRAVALFLQGFSPPEVGRMLGWTEPKARNLIYRGMKDLRAALRTMGIDCEMD